MWYNRSCCTGWKPQSTYTRLFWYPKAICDLKKRPSNTDIIFKGTNTDSECGLGADDVINIIACFHSSKDIAIQGSNNPYGKILHNTRINALIAFPTLFGHWTLHFMESDYHHKLTDLNKSVTNGGAHVILLLHSKDQWDTEQATLPAGMYVL